MLLFTVDGFWYKSFWGKDSVNFNGLSTSSLAIIYWVCEQHKLNLECFFFLFYSVRTQVWEGELGRNGRNKNISLGKIIIIQVRNTCRKIKTKIQYQKWTTERSFNLLGHCNDDYRWNIIAKIHYIKTQCQRWWLEEPVFNPQTCASSSSITINRQCKVQVSVLFPCKNFIL